MKADIDIKRARLAPAPNDGQRILVDRLWPRGIRKSDAAIDIWNKDVAPSTGLRQWFGHDPERWEEFRQRYKAELADMPDQVNALRALARQQKITLVYAAHDELHNNAVVLREVLLAK